MENTLEKMKAAMANTYALYLKTQNYHWHVRGLNFKELHMMFEEEYLQLAAAVDTLAERNLTLGDQAPATFSALEQLKTISDGDSSANALEMIQHLHDDHGTLIQNFREVLMAAHEHDDEGTIAVASERIAQHEKSRWMLGALLG